jgi:hypothetical protein
MALEVEVRLEGAEEEDEHPRPLLDHLISGGE